MDVQAVLRRLGPVVPLVVIVSVCTLIGFIWLAGSMKPVSHWLREQGAWAVGLYVAGFALTAGLGLLPTHIQALLGGLVFGLWHGVGAALAGILGAVSIAYVIARRVSGQRVTGLIAEQPKWKAVHDALLGGGFWKTLGIVTLVRIPPNSPFAITNLVLAATRVRWLPYAIGTVAGIAPRTAAAVWIGSQLAELDLKSARQTWFFVSGIVALVVVVAIIGTLAKHALAKVTDNSSASAGA
ncbi:MAG TPA: VTT domain-containing protein [Phycisphaerae bacterium]|nr:VTT domain-containing protein [Phycisphaerae bacterium]